MGGRVFFVSGRVYEMPKCLMPTCIVGVSCWEGVSRMGGVRFLELVRCLSRPVGWWEGHTGHEEPKRLVLVSVGTSICRGWCPY